MFEQILISLKTKYKDLGLSENYLKVVAKRLAKAVNEESEIENAVLEVEDELKIQQSQDDVIRNLKAQLKKLEENGKQNLPKEETPKENPKQEEIPAWAKVLIESNKTLSERLEKQETDKINQTNEQKLISKLNDLGVSEFFYKSQIVGKTFENDEQIIEFAQNIKDNEDAYIQAVSDVRLKSQETPKFGVGVKENEVSPEVQSFIQEKLKKDE